MIGTHTGPGPARTSARNSRLLLYQARGNVCSIIRTWSYLKRKSAEPKASAVFTVKSSISYTLLEIPTPYFYVLILSFASCNKQP